MLLVACAVAAQEPTVEDEAVSDEEPVAQEPVSGDEAVEMEEGETFDEPLPITTTVFLEGNSTGEQLEIVIHRWTGVLPPPEEDDEDRVPPDEEGEEVEAEPQSFVVSVSEQPSFIQNISWIDGPELVFEPGESSKTVTLVFDTAAEGESGLPEEEAELVLQIDARDDEVEPSQRELVVPLVFKRALEPGDAAVTVCALREDAPEDFPIEEAFQYCDPERVPVLKYDRAVAFVTPARDLRLPIGEDQDFSLQILGPDGNKVGGLTFWNEGSEDEPDLSVPFTVEGSPGRFAIPLHLWRQGQEMDPARDLAEPEIYTVQTVDVRVAGSAVFGQGEATTYIDGEWVDEATFEISDRAFEFKTFVAEQAGEVHFPYNPRLRLGSVTYGEPKVQGARVAIDLAVDWRWHGKEAEQATSRLVFDFPARILPGYETAGEMTASLEQLSVSTEDYAYVLAAGVHDPVATATAPPRRALAASDAPIWEATRKEVIGRRHDAADGSQCYLRWVWTQGEEASYGRQEVTSGSCSFSFLGIRDVRDTWGEPARDLASRLHDPESLLVIPVYYAVRGETRGDLAVNGYAIYGVGPDPYEGPPPTEKPEGGTGPAAPPVLKLLEISGYNLHAEDGYQYTPGQPGFSRTHEAWSLEGELSSTTTESARMLGLPLEIHLGEPIQVGADVAKSISWGPVGQCSVGGGASASLHASWFGGLFSAKGVFVAPCPADHPQYELFSGGQREVGGGSASMSMNLLPVQTVEVGSTELQFHYRTQVSVPGGENIPDDQEGVLYKWYYDYQTDSKGFLVEGATPYSFAGAEANTKLRISVQLGRSGEGVEALYGPVHAPDEGLGSIPPYENPPGAIAPPPDTGETDPDEPGSGEDSEETPEGGDDTGVDETGEGEDPGTGEPGGGITVPPGTGAIDPNRPDIAAHIRTWLAVAEPPENATTGADFHYNDWGVKLGQAPGGVITGTPGKPDDVGARTSPQYVWPIRERLDSVDHCTLGEYVGARLEGSAADQCVGRYKGTVQQLAGMASSSAEAKVRQLKWVPVISRGDPAPTRELTGTVQRQNPPSGTLLSRGEAVQLWVYEEPAPQLLTVPDLHGSSSRMATAWLEDLGLVAMLRPGSAAPSAQQKGSVERQDPPPGRQVEIGSVVTLNVYREPIPFVQPTPRPATIDCTRWPGAVAVWDPASNSSRCDCPEGVQWNATGSGCEPVVNADQQYCDSNWPGTLASRDPASGSLECQCPAGLGWDDRALRCVAVSTVEVQPILIGQTTDCRHMPGTIAQRDASGRMRCRCPVGSWNAAQRRCVTEALPTLDPPGCTAHYSHIRGFLALGKVAEAQRSVQAARAMGCNPQYIDEAFPPGTGSGTGSGTGTGAGAGTGGGRCEDLGRSLSEPLFQGRLSRQDAERQMNAAGCGDALDSLCPYGNFGQNVYPDCLGEVLVGPGPAGGTSGGGASSGPTCFIQEYGAGPGGGLVMAARFGQHTNYYVMAVPDDAVNDTMRIFKEQHGAWLVGRNSTYQGALGRARGMCANPTRAPGG